MDNVKDITQKSTNKTKDRRLDIIIWGVNLTRGNNSIKLWYLTKFDYIQEGEAPWWWTLLWNIQAPPKTFIFTWLVLRSAILSWDNILRQRCEGCNWLHLCEKVRETIKHLLID